MGITSFIGMIICFATIVGGIIILGGDLMNFYNLPSILLTVVPTIGALVATYPLSLLGKLPSNLKVIIRKEPDPTEYIEKIVELANKVRIDGMLALEGEEVKEPIMKFGVQMMVDGIQETEMSKFLEDTLTSMNTRHAETIAFYEKAAAYAPAFGMCATIVSLVNMLMGLDFRNAEAVNQVGGNMSAALITTLYGSVMANIIFLPIAGRLKLLHKRELFNKTLICNGLISILRGTGPKFIREALYEQLNNELRKRGGKAKDAKYSGGEQ